MNRLQRCRLPLLLGVLGLAAAATAAPTDLEVEALYRQLLPQVDRNRLVETYRTIESFGSRLTGSSGEQKTFDYVAAQLAAKGAVKIRRETFPVTIPNPDVTGTITIGGRSTSLWPLWPNLVRTSTCDVQGTLVYGGNGTMEALSGTDIKGRIVVLEFGSGARWRNAAKLGAAAVIFVQPDSLPRGEAEQKFSGVPIDLPRFYLPLKDAGSVLAAAMRRDTAHLACRQDWVVRQSANLIAEMPGTSKEPPVALMAYADASSVVPGLSPGAEAIGGIAALLETAEIYSKRPHRRSLTFVLSGAHTLGLLGAREYVRKRMADGQSPLLTVTLDLSSGGSAIGSYARGWFYEFRDEAKHSMEQTSRLLRAHADHLSTVTGIAPARLLLIDAVNNGDNRSWKNNIPGKFALDCEPMVMSGMNALTFRTVEDGRDAIDTPFDTVDRIQFTNVRRQTQTLVAMMHHCLNDTTDTGETSDYRIPLTVSNPQEMSLIGGFATAKGRVVEYDPERSFIPDISVPNSLACLLGKQKTLMGVRGDRVQATSGPKSEYEFIGVQPVSAMVWNQQEETRLAAFHLNPQTGKIDYAPTWNTPGFDAYWIEFMMKSGERESPIVVFPCVPISLFDLVDPQELKALQRVRVLDAVTGSFPRNFGVFSPGFDQRLSPDIEDAQVVFLSPGQKFQLIGGSMGELTRLVITGSSLGDEKGVGFTAIGGKGPVGKSAGMVDGLLYNLPLTTARDLSAINRTRLAKFKKYRIVGAGISDLQASADKEIIAADAAIAAKDWAAADRHSRAAWGYALRAHPVIMTTANDVVNGVVFYLFLLIPFSFFLERLMVGNQLLTKQLGASVAIFMGSFLLLRLIHPAFEIVTNPSMIFIAFVMGVLSLIVMSFILGKFESSMRAVKAQQVGVHEVDIRRSSVAMAAFNLGVSNMRRRKARTLLTTLTLVVMTFIVLSFTSIVNELRLDETPSPNVATYGGILMRNPGLDPMQLATYRQIANEFAGKGTVVRRTYYYGADIGDIGILSLQRANNVAECRAMLGLDPDEDKVLKPQEALLPGGRWFRPGERNVMILPQALAEALKVNPSEVGKAKVNYAGTDYTVIGIADTAILRSKIDLDGDGLLPADFTLSRQFQEQKATSNQAFRSFIRLDPSTVFIVPAETAMALGSDLRTVAIEFPDPKTTRTALESLMPRLRINLYAGVATPDGLEVKQFSVQQASKSGGLLLILVQLGIASIFVLNTMIASVFERTKEIAIFSSIGLAPNHIAMLFFAESLVYGILGAVIGYFVAQASAKVIVATNTLQGLTLNFSSTSAVMSAVLVMAVVLLSTIYPARKAAQIAAPAMNEEVFETEPDGDVWNLPLPFSINAAEAGPLAAFLTQWLKAYEGYTIGDFVTADSSLSAEAAGRGVAYHVRAVTWLAPYDLGVSQRLDLFLSPSVVGGVYQLDLEITRLGGDPENWPIVNRRFLANIRRQFLTWRTLGKEDRAKFVGIAESIAAEVSNSTAA